MDDMIRHFAISTVCQYGSGVMNVASENEKKRGAYLTSWLPAKANEDWGELHRRYLIEAQRLIIGGNYFPSMGKNMLISSNLFDKISPIRGLWGINTLIKYSSQIQSALILAATIH